MTKAGIQVNILADFAKDIQEALPLFKVAPWKHKMILLSFYTHFSISNVTIRF